MTILSLVPELMGRAWPHDLSIMPIEKCFLTKCFGANKEEVLYFGCRNEIERANKLFFDHKDDLFCDAIESIL
jgi:hypothetical protein